MRQACQHLDRWRALASGERWLLVGLAVVLPTIGGALRAFGVRRTYRILAGTLSGARESQDVDDAALANANQLGRLVNIAARRGPRRATCLQQSLALWWLLRRRRLPAELRIGVGKEGANMHAHAWVELAGRVINDRASIANEYAVYRELGRRLPRHGAS